MAETKTIPRHGDDLKILAVGMMPPPIGGQALMFKAAVERLSQVARVDLVDLQVQSNIGATGALSLKKVLKFAAIFCRCLSTCWQRAPFDVLYYCPSGPSRIGLVKDIILLAVLRRFCRKTVYHFHGTGGMGMLTQMGWIANKMASRYVWQPDLAIRCASVEPDDAKTAQSAESTVIPNGIPDPTELFDEGWEWTRPKEHKLSFVGVITEEKGVFDLVRALAILNERGLSATAELIGQGVEAELSTLRDLIRDGGLETHVKLHGVVKGKAKFELVGSSTLFVFPTFFRAETQPLAVIEAFAMGVPVVASNWRGIDTIVDHATNGLLVPPQKPEALADAIEDALTRRDLAEFSKHAREKFERAFKEDVFVEALHQALVDQAKS